MSLCSCVVVVVVSSSLAQLLQYRAKYRETLLCCVHVKCRNKTTQQQWETKTESRYWNRATIASTATAAAYRAAIHRNGRCTRRPKITASFPQSPFGSGLDGTASACPLFSTLYWRVTVSILHRLRRRFAKSAAVLTAPSARSCDH